MSSYWIDLSTVSLENYWDTLAKKHLMPARKSLQQDMKPRLAVLQSQNITNLAELLSSVKTKKRLENFANTTALDSEWLILLRREVQSLTPKPVEIKRFPDVALPTIEKLASLGIKHSKNMFDECSHNQTIATLAEKLVLDPSAVDDVACMSDLVRINGIGPIYARILLKADIRSTREIAQSHSNALYKTLALWTERENLKVTFNEGDLQTCIDMANSLPRNI